MKTFLKVKIKSLWAEAKIIQEEERKALTLDESQELYSGLYGHRKGIVAQEQRATLIAYGFLRGKPLIKIEMHPLKIPEYIKRRVYRMVNKYGIKYFSDINELNKRLDKWFMQGYEDSFKKLLEVEEFPEPEPEYDSDEKARSHFYNWLTTLDDLEKNKVRPNGLREFSLNT